MSGPGVSVPDVTEGITQIEDLPQPRIKPRSRNFSCRRVPSVGVARAAGVWPPAPFMILVTPSADDRSTSGSATPRIAVRPVGAPFLRTSPTWPRPRVITPTGCHRPPCDWWSRMAYPIAWPVGTCGATTESLSLGPPSRIGSRPRGKKSRAVMDTDYLERALVHFSGYLAVDELYDGPFCVFSLVDHRAFVRLSFRVLEHDPTQDDLRRFLAEFKAQLDARPDRPGCHHRWFGAVSRAAP